MRLGGRRGKNKIKDVPCFHTLGSAPFGTQMFTCCIPAIALLLLIIATLSIADA